MVPPIFLQITPAEFSTLNKELMVWIHQAAIDDPPECNKLGDIQGGSLRS